MTQKRWDGTSFVDLTTRKRWDGATWVTLTVGKRWDGTTWVDVLGGGGGGGLSVTADVGTLVGFVYMTGPYPPFVTVTSGSPVTVTPTGGTAPYTYKWEHESGDRALQVVSPNSATTYFQANVGREQEVVGTKRCIVTDSLGATGYVDVGGVLYYTTDL